MASLRAALLLLPPFSVVVVLAARWLCRVMARRLRALARSQFARLPSGGGPSCRYLPVAIYHRRTSCVVGEEAEEECVFCLSGIEEGSEVTELRCRHLFHRACLDRWLRARPVATCPLCHGRLLPSLPREVAGGYNYDDDDEEEEEEEGDGEAAEEDDLESDMFLFMACVHSRSSWLWPS